MPNEPQESNRPLTELDILARNLVGDGRAPNMFFVSTALGGVRTVTHDFRVAWAEWNELVLQSRGLLPTLEDRVHGTLASVEVGEETRRLCIIDDTVSYGLRKQ